MPPDRELLKSLIREAFSGVEYPGDWCLRNSNEGEEPLLVSRDFAGRCDWRLLDSAFLDQAPEGWGTALCFFSDEAFHFYLPAYLLADIDGGLRSVDPTFHLCHGLDDRSRREFINPRRYGQRTWFDHAIHRFAMFSQPEAKAISAYLRFKQELYAMAGSPDRSIAEALNSYWIPRCEIT